MSFVNCVSANNYSTSGIYYDPGLTFTNFTLGNGWSTSDNYNITGDAAITGMADDGTDIGIHGGASNFSEKGEPLNVDIIRTLNVLNTAAPNGTLNVNITAGKPTDH
jgi:hypothetical protein